MNQLSKLFLFVHPMPYRKHTREEYLAKWEEVLAVQGPDEQNVICILANELKEMELLRDMARRYFKERCVLDPDDYSVETKALLAEDLQRTFEQRGGSAEWLPYEMWSSSNARRWTEGLKRSLSDLGFTYDPDNMHMITCGQQWGGCLAKYSTLMSKYLGLTKPADVRADLSPDAGFPVKATFVERVQMDRHVYLFLFRMPDGRPMGQYLDGLRAVWEFPHIATVPVDPAKVEIVTTSPNAYVKVDEASRGIEGGGIADVGDGCHPAATTLIGNQIEYEPFRASLIKAEIRLRDTRSLTQYMVGYLDPVTTYRVPE